MKPIINPWIFYLASVCDGFKFFCCGVLIALVIALCVLFIMFCATGDEYFAEERKSYKSLGKKLIIPIFICSIFLIFIPSQTTIYKMIVANCITENNITKSKEEAKELIDYIVDKIGEINKESEGE